MRLAGWLAGELYPVERVAALRSVALRSVALRSRGVASCRALNARARAPSRRLWSLVPRRRSIFLPAADSSILVPRRRGRSLLGLSTAFLPRSTLLAYSSRARPSAFSRLTRLALARSRAPHNTQCYRDNRTAVFSGKHEIRIHASSLARGSPRLPLFFLF